jgi:tetratricopeptide (TPR) repeat protein
MLTDNASGRYGAEFTEEEAANAYPAAIADYEAAVQHTPTSAPRRMTQLDLAYISGNWRGLTGRIGLALDEPGCNEGNWTSIIVDGFGYSERFLERAMRVLACDPRRSLSWFNVARSALRMGDKDEALRLAREGTEIAPGSWLATALVRALVAHGLHDEARKEIDDRIQNVDVALAFKALIMAHEGDQARFDQFFEEFKTANTAGYYWEILVAAWGGHRDEANRMAALIDQHHFGPVTLTQVTQWCACGAPFDLDATPNFAAKLEEGNLTWPPQPVMEFPLKDW